ncbi:carboxypeptidase-like regulatory domain-containing protein [Methanooceanicella nereidis]|nr:carboxypeptidase-like regulatory domain-containing protein [Methanocella sp. CWC-04]
MGSISGMVTSGDNAAIPDATVALWMMDGDVITGLLEIEDNPQYTTNQTSPVVGLYSFFNVPSGVYNITAEKDGYWFFTEAVVTEGTTTANIVIPEYVASEYPAGLGPYEPPERQYFTYVPVIINRTPPEPTITRTSGPDILAFAIAMLFALSIVRKRKKI